MLKIDGKIVISAFDLKSGDLRQDDLVGATVATDTKDPSQSEVRLSAEWTFDADKISFGEAGDLSYPAPTGIGSIQDMRIHEATRNHIVWNDSQNRKVAYRWPDRQLPKRDMTNLLVRIPPLIYRGILVERNGRLVKVDERDPSLRR